MNESEDFPNWQFQGLPRVDEIGPWSVIKLSIIKEYAKPYSQILTKHPRLSHAYIDAFSGAGVARLKSSSDYVLGSPLNALLIDPPFENYFFIDFDSDKAKYLTGLVGERRDVIVHEGDCNRILPELVFPQVRREDYRRALCLLDPYGLHLDWSVVFKAGQMGSIEIFLNFPVHDINRNVLRSNTKKQNPSDIARMNSFWGDDSWAEETYRKEYDLFEGTQTEKFASSEALVKKFRTRLREIAGFAYVPEPIPMRNSVGGVLYYLFFASPNSTGARIVEDIFNKYRNLGKKPWPPNQK